VITRVGRVSVCTILIRRGPGHVTWDTVVLTDRHGPGRPWEPPATEILERVLTWGESFITHAMVVGYVRLGLELEPARCSVCGCPWGECKPPPEQRAAPEPAQVPRPLVKSH